MVEQEKGLICHIAEMEEDAALALAQEMLDTGFAPFRVLDLWWQAMDIVGKRFEQGEYFLPELIRAGKLFDRIGAMAKPLIVQSSERPDKTVARGSWRPP